MGDLAPQVGSLLKAAGLTVVRSATAPTHVRLAVTDGTEQTILDLVADPVPTLVPTMVIEVEGTEILSDAPYEILVNKLCALLGRSELRDLADVVALRGIGLDLIAALQDAPKKDPGFSPLTFVWVLRNLDIVRLGRLEGWDADHIAELSGARQGIIDAVLDAIAQDEQS